MIPLIESLVDAFETRHLSRRELVASVAALVATGVSASAQTPAVQQISKVAQGATINHISLAVTDVERSAHFYSKLLGLKGVMIPLVIAVGHRAPQARVEPRWRRPFDDVVRVH